MSRLEPDWWIELESTYQERIKQRLDIFQKHGTNVLAMLPGSEPACRELLEMVLQFLCQRYPHHFSLSATAKEVVFHNKILGKSECIGERSPLEMLLGHVPEDFAIMDRDAAGSGRYHFRAGIICSSVGWNLGSKIGMALADIHGPVPDYKEKMSLSMDRYFGRLPTNGPIQRGSWSFELDQPLYLEPSALHHEASYIQGLGLEEAISRIHYRVDWQTLRRLPRSGAIAFNFKALFTPLTQLRTEPFVPALALKVLREGKKSVLQYKGTHRTERVVVPTLERYAAEQVQLGLVPEDWEVETLEESPFFPGWQQHWRER
jgi:hypothetical protein